MRIAIFLAIFALLAFGIVESDAHRASLPRLFTMPAKKCYRGDGWTGKYVYCHDVSLIRPGGMGRVSYR